MRKLDELSLQLRAIETELARLRSNGSHDAGS